MRAVLLSALVLMTSVVSNAQFYPSANAVWCGGDDNGGPPGFNVQFQMGIFPDTLINATGYKKISEYNSATGQFILIRDYYVRSDPNGRGYVYLPDSMAEFLTGDIFAESGDTVRNVLFAVSGESYVSYLLEDFIVDSVVQLSNAGVTVTRQYLDPTGFNPLGASQVFWQAGMGTSFGPVMEGSGGFVLCGVGNAIQYDLGNNGLPGPDNVGEICWPISTNVNEGCVDKKPVFIPNPSTGIFTIGIPTPSTTVYTSTGQQVWKGTGNTIDLSSQPPGVYTAVVATERGRQAVRLVVVR
jgi:hypothetical protein